MVMVVRVQWKIMWRLTCGFIFSVVFFIFAEMLENMHTPYPW